MKKNKKEEVKIAPKSPEERLSQKFVDPIKPMIMAPIGSKKAYAVIMPVRLDR